MSKRAAAALAESEFAAQQRRAAAEAGSRHSIIDQIQVGGGRWLGPLSPLSVPVPLRGTLAASPSSTRSR